MPRERRQRRGRKKRTDAEDAAQNSLCGCTGLATLGAGLCILYLVLFIFTAYVHHASPVQFFRATWKHRTHFMGFHSYQEDSRDDLDKIAELEMHTKGSRLESGTQSEDVAVALPLERPDDVRGVWTRVLDEKTNKFYYHNTQENTVTWDTPPIWKEEDLPIATSTTSSNFSSSSNVNTVDTEKSADAHSDASAGATVSPIVTGDNISASSTTNVQTSAPNSFQQTVTIPVTSSTASVMDVAKCGSDRGLSALKQSTAKHFSNEKSNEIPLWLRVVMISHGRYVGGPNEKSRPQEDMLRAVRTLMMDAATSGGSPFGSSLGAVVVNLAGPNNNPSFEAAKREALGDLVNSKGKSQHHFDFVESGFDLIGSCGSSARRDFFAALEIGLNAGSCEHILLLEAGESLCPSALLMLYYAVQKANDYDPTWSTLRVGKGKHGYGGLVVRCSAAKKLLLNPEALGGTASTYSFLKSESQSQSESTLVETDVEKFSNDLASWMRKERQRTVLSILPDRPIGGSFAYRYRLISENLIGEGCGSQVELPKNHNDLSFHGDAKCNDNDISPCAASENDAWLEYIPPNIPSVIGSNVRLVIGRQGQSCIEACQKQADGNGGVGLQCLSGHSVGRNLNDCSTLRGRFPCPSGCVSLTAEKGNWPVPSQLVSDAKINSVTVYKGTCIIRQNGPISLCSHASDDTSRLCPCGKAGLGNSGVALLDTVGGKVASNNFSPPNEGEIVIGELGENCIDVCAKNNKHCSQEKLADLNNCKTLKDKFQCNECQDNEGDDQPCLNELGVCLVKSNRFAFSCSGSYSTTRRLCYCV